jgi:predicted transcriptional regulator
MNHQIGRTILYTKSDIAEVMGVTTQAVSNYIRRYEDFPGPEYSNSDGSVCLYTAEDLKEIYAFLTVKFSEANDRLAAKLGSDRD